MNQILDDDIPYKPANAPDLAVHLTVTDIERSLQFYREAFKFELYRKPIIVEDQMLHAVMQHEEARITLAPEGAWGYTRQAPITLNIQCPMLIFMYVKDVDSFFKNAVEKGATVVNEPFEAFWGDKACRLLDPDGYQWTFATKIADFDPKKIPK